MELSEMNVFFYDSVVDVFVCDSLNSIWNKLDSRGLSGWDALHSMIFSIAALSGEVQSS